MSFLQASASKMLSETGKKRSNCVTFNDSSIHLLGVLKNYFSEMCWLLGVGLLVGLFALKSRCQGQSGSLCWRGENSNSSSSQLNLSSGVHAPHFPEALFKKNLKIILIHFSLLENNYACSANKFASLTCDSKSEVCGDAARMTCAQISYSKGTRSILMRLSSYMMIY